MKKLLSLFLLSTLFFACSSDDDNSITPQSKRRTIYYEVEGYIKFSSGNKEGVVPMYMAIEYSDQRDGKKVWVIDPTTHIKYSRSADIDLMYEENEIFDATFQCSHDIGQLSLLIRNQDFEHQDVITFTRVEGFSISTDPKAEMVYTTTVETMTLFEYLDALMRKPHNTKTVVIK